MQTKIKNIVMLGAIALMSACNNSDKVAQTTSKMPAKVDSIANDVVSETGALKGDFCFLKAENKDSTTVRIRVLSNDDIRGEMIWNPWQKDGAVGSLTGKLNPNKELELVYDYTIEGSRQSETKTMKIEKGKLYIKRGELIDPKNNGNLVYKDVSKAQYTEILDKTDCD